MSRVCRRRMGRRNTWSGQNSQLHETYLDPVAVRGDGEEPTHFYKHVAHDWEAPLKTMTYKAEGRFEFQCLIFMPARAPFDLYYHTAEYGVQLYAQRVMIMEQCTDLIPRYLRFLKGVVDSADLPLNISRQRLQQDRHITEILLGSCAEYSIHLPPCRRMTTRPI